MANRRLKPLPRKSNEAVNEQLTPYNQPKVDKDNAFTKNRAYDISQKEDETKNFSIGLKDIDEAIKYYFENVIKPSVIVKGKRTPVPILYGNQELWKTMQADGYTRDKNGKLMTPLILFKRDTITKNRNLGNKQDANSPSLYQLFEKKYTKGNQYDAFSVLTNRIPVREYVMTVVPDYVTVTYSCVVFTEYMEQINPIIEAINYASDSYWGDLNRFKFKSYIDQFSTITELNIGEDRAVKSTFNIVLQGYIIPETINKELAAKNRVFSKSQIAFNIEASSVDLETLQISKAKSINVGSSILENTINISNHTENVVNNYSTFVNEELTYINTNQTKQATTINSDNVIFANTNVVQPPAGSTLPPTSKVNFAFFVNGQYIPSNAVISLSETGNMVFVVFDTTILDYQLESDDEVIGVGKFKDA